MPPTTQSILRAGSIGGITLGLAVAAQRFATDYAMQSLGLIIVIVGFSVIGLFAARDSEAKRGRDGLRIGLLSGLVAGFFVALAYIAINIIMALDPKQVELVRAQYPQQLAALREVAPSLAAQSLSQWNAMNAKEQAAFTQMAFSISACCGVAYPLMGSALGAMGGAIAPGMFGIKRD